MTGRWGRSLEKVFINGVTADSTTDTGKIIACMDMEYMFGQMEGRTVENT